MTIDTATVARALSRTLEGKWMCDDQFHTCWASQIADGKIVRSMPDPRESTDVCLEMLRASGWSLEASPKNASPICWGVRIPQVYRELLIPTSGQPFRDAVLRRCAGEE